ncbi:hypothetical protein [Streptomyces sp. NPDC048338]|uniref:hypothetical protein n=1 Tax=Streptomyces sp. NPDC048338 TaxID=3365536 RepID=UPI0037172467
MGADGRWGAGASGRSDRGPGGHAEQNTTHLRQFHRPSRSTPDVGGGYLCRTQEGAEDVRIEAGDVLPEDRVFVGCTPGFVDDERILVVTAEEQWAEEVTHLLLDAHTLRPLAALDYPRPPGVAAVPLGDGTWLTVEEETVRRWTIPSDPG